MLSVEVKLLDCNLFGRQRQLKKKKKEKKKKEKIIVNP